MEAESMAQRAFQAGNDGHPTHEKACFPLPDPASALPYLTKEQAPQQPHARLKTKVLWQLLAKP